MSRAGRASVVSLIAVFLVLVVTQPAAAQWLQFQNETATRLNVADPSLVQSDPHEKEYAWADFDKDGDDDLVIVRKLPYIQTAGPLPNVLLINENGVLTDRTADFAAASDVEGDLGFLTPTTDREATVVDVDQDGWLDLVTGATLSGNAPKHVGHPRVYRNLGCGGDCDGTDDWLGFIYEADRIPSMLSYSGQSGFNPCLCGVAAGDLTGDSYPELWLVDYDDGCGQPGADFNSRLLINLGAADPGTYVDQTDTRFQGLVGGLPFVVNVDSLSGSIVDLNGDDVPEVLLESEGIIDIAYGDPANPGFYDTYDTLQAFSAYFMDVADLNNDGLIDLITTDDGADRYYLNQGSSGPGIPTAAFVSYPYTFDHTGSGGAPTDDGFGDDSRAADLDNDGWLDVLTADRDFTSPGCNRRGHIYHNLGGEIGGFVSLVEETTGFGCQNFQGNPASCKVAGLPAQRLKGLDDYGIIDIDGDGWLDLVIGTCSGTEVYMNVPPVGPAGGVPDGDTIAGSVLLADRAPGSSQVSLNWGDSCSLTDSDYAVYQGGIAAGFGSHAEVTCSTGGSTSHAFEPIAGNAYFLVVPNNGTFEGSYGFASGGVQRGQGSSSCMGMSTQPCE